jgi:hypothetical protein
MLALIVQGYGSVPVVVAMVVSALLLFPWPLTRRVCIPLGLVRLSWFTALFADYTWGRDMGGGRATAAVLAAWHGKKTPRSRLFAVWQRLTVRPSDLAFARAKVQSLDLLGAAGATAAGLLADVDGDAAGADAIFAVVDFFDDAVVPLAAKGIVADRRLMATLRDASLSQAQKREAILALSSTSVAVAFVQAILVRDDVVDDASFLTRATRQAVCLARFVMLPHPWAAWPVLRGAPVLPADPAPQATPTTTTTAATAAAMTTPAAPAVSTAVGFGDAAKRHAELSQQRQVSVDDVATLALLWGARLDEQQQAMTARAKALGVDGAQLSRGLSAQVLSALSALTARLDLRDVDVALMPPLLAEAISALRSERLDGLEIAVAAWRSRLESKTPKSPVDELRELGSLMALKGDVARVGKDGPFIAFEASQWVLCELAVWLWNERREPRLGNAIFRALLADAKAVGDTRSIETQIANVACGP